MAFSRIVLTNQSWTLIGNNVTEITFQNSSSFPIYINVTTTNTAPTSLYGIIYDSHFGESQLDPTKLNSSHGNYVWAKSTQSVGSIIVDVA